MDTTNNSAGMKNLPNRITISRILLIFVFVALANIDAEKFPNYLGVTQATSQLCHIIAYVVAIIAGVTDLLDGFLARKFHLESDFGRLMDPLADKIFILATFVMMADYRLMPAWIVIVILTREFMVTGLRTLATSKGVVISADRWGKLKTFLQMFSLLIGGAGWIGMFNLHIPVIWYCWYGMLIIVTAITVFSGLGYFIRHRELYLAHT